MDKTNINALVQPFERSFHSIKKIDYQLRAYLHGGREPQVGEVICGGLPHLTCKRDHIIKMRDCMDRRVTPPKRVTSPTWGPPPPCKQALKSTNSIDSVLIVAFRQLIFCLTMFRCLYLNK